MNIFVNKILYMTVLIFIGFLFVYILKVAFVFFLPFILAYIISKLMNPLKTIFVKKFHIPTRLASFITILFILSLVLIILIWLINMLIPKLAMLTTDLPKLGNSIYISLTSAIDRIEEYLNIDQDFFDEIFKNFMDFVVTSATTFSKNLIKSLLDFLTFIPNLFFYTFVTLIAVYFISNDLEIIQKKANTLINKNNFISNLNKTFKKDLLIILKAYIKSQGVLMLITFFITSAGLVFLGYKYAILFAIGISILDAFPIFGTGTVFIPWSLIELLNENYKIAAFLIVIFLIASITRQILQPKLLSIQMNINPLLVLISIYVGIKLLGVFGIILGPLFLIIIASSYDIIKNSYFKTD